MASWTEVVADLGLARRLEWTEARSNIEFVEARARISPGIGAEWIEVAGAAVMYDGADSPCTQTFGLGMRAELTEEGLDRIEDFYRQRGAPVFHEVSPLSDIAVHQMLCRRGYWPVEMSSVMYRMLDVGPAPAGEGWVGDGDEGGLLTRAVGRAELGDWAKLSASGWSEFPEYSGLMYDLALVAASRDGSLSFVAEIDGQPVGTAGLSIVDGVALLTGASTLPEFRRRGVQRRLLEARLADAAARGCQLAMVCALPGSASQRNAERAGFRIAYTRIKWGLGMKEG